MSNPGERIGLPAATTALRAAANAEPTAEATLGVQLRTVKGLFPFSIHRETTGIEGRSHAEKEPVEMSEGAVRQ